MDKEIAVRRTVGRPFQLRKRSVRIEQAIDQCQKPFFLDSLLAVEPHLVWMKLRRNQTVRETQNDLRDLEKKMKRLN